MSIKIDTGKVDMAATRIESANQKIRDDFSALNDAVNTLNRHWDGAASEIAVQTFGRIRGAYVEQRYSVVNGLVLFLRAQVSSDYSQTESHIRTAAESFK